MKSDKLPGFQVKVDAEANALYLTFSEGAVAQSVHAGTDVVADYDANGKLMGIEVLKIPAANAK